MEETVPAPALQESEELHRITLMNMSDAVFITDDDGVFTFICPNVDVIFGYGHDEVRRDEPDLRTPWRRARSSRRSSTRSGEVRNIEHEIEDEGWNAPCAARAHQAGRDQARNRPLCLPRHHRAQAVRAGAPTERGAAEAGARGRQHGRTWDRHVPSGEMDWSVETHPMFGYPAGNRPPSFDSFLDRVGIPSIASAWSRP